MCDWWQSLLTRNPANSQILCIFVCVCILSFCRANLKLCSPSFSSHCYLNKMNICGSCFPVRRGGIQGTLVTGQQDNDILNKVVLLSIDWQFNTCIILTLQQNDFPIDFTRPGEFCHYEPVVLISTPVFVHVYIYKIR